MNAQTLELLMLLALSEQEKKAAKPRKIKR